jgi:hypothetical protein
LSIAVKIKIQVELLLVHSLCYQLDVLWMSRNFWHNKFYNFFCIFWYASYLFWLERKETKKQRKKERKKSKSDASRVSSQTPQPLQTSSHLNCDE